MESWQRHCVWWGHKPGLMLTSAWEEATPLIQVWTELAQPVLQLCHRSLPACTASRLSQRKHRPTFNHLFPPHKWGPKSACYYYFTLSCKLILIANLISLRNTCVSRASWWVSVRVFPVRIRRFYHLLWIRRDYWPWPHSGSRSTGQV